MWGSLALRLLYRQLRIDPLQGGNAIDLHRRGQALVLAWVNLATIRELRGIPKEKRA